MTRQKPRKSRPNARARQLAYKERLKLPFLENYKETRRIYAAAEAVGIDRKTVNRWREEDQDFREKFEEVEIHITEDLKASTLSRAIDGTKYQTQFGPRREFSDALAVLHLKQRDPSFRDRVQVDIARKAIASEVAAVMEIIRREVPEPYRAKVVKALEEQQVNAAGEEAL